MHNENKVFNPKNMNKLEHPDRYKELPPQDILDAVGLESGQVFGDFGCGIGYFSIPAAERVGKDGHVIAMDISQEMLDGLKDRLDDAHKSRITLTRDGIEGGCLDVAMISTVLHEVDDPQLFLIEASASLRPGGKIAVLEWMKEKMEQGPKYGIRISEQEMIQMLIKAGFYMEKTIHLSDRFYLIIAVKE
ncbi:class I SAM-dependent methyltransferase [Fusibacter sp. JL216-2]|uniref:class I SAM-dependent methyltransferase n=1 Tax=Fusibacter sp. JL216-2 TaxID=3071453 RepID=UPI003D3423DF